MRIDNIALSLTMNVPFNKPDLNGTLYTKEAVENAIRKMSDHLPIITYRDNDEAEVIGCTDCKPYAIQCDEGSKCWQYTIDGTLYFGGTECICYDIHDGAVHEFKITGIGISK